MDKSGRMGDKMMFSIFLFIIIIILAGIVGGVYIFYGIEYEFRQAEAAILNYNIKKCIMEKEIDWENRDNFYTICGLNKEVIEKNNIIKICTDSTDCVSEEKILFSSGSNFQACRFEGVKGNDKYPKCSLNKFMKNGKEFEIITGSNQFSRRVNS